MKSGTERMKTGIYSNLVVFGLFVLITLVIYGNSLKSPFQFDDDGVIVKNLNAQDIRNIPYFFIEPHLSVYNPAHEGHYRPFVTASYAINYAAGKLDPFGYHLVNMVIHAGSAFLVFLIVKVMAATSVLSRHRNTITNILFAAIAAGLIFLTHPFNSEAVTYITARSSTMSGFFYLLAFYFWLKFREQGVISQSTGKHNSRYYIASLLAFVIGMLCKEILITLPAVLWLYDVYIFYPGQHVHERKSIRSDKNTGGEIQSCILNWRSYLQYLPFVFIVIIPYFLIRIVSYKGVLSPFQRDIFTQLMTEAPVLVKHWQMFFIPNGLSLFHDVKIYNGMTLSVISSLILFGLYMIIAVYLLRLKELYWKIISFFMFWFFIVLLPTTIIPLNMIFQENRGYLAIVSFSVIAGVIIGEISKKSGRAVLVVSMSILVLVYGLLTIQRNTVWQDDIRLWKDAIKNAPLSVLAYAGLADAYRMRGDIFLSIETAKKGLTVDPNNYSIRINLGRSYQLAGDFDQAIKEYEEAVKIEPSQAIIWNELATLYSKKGDLEHTEFYLKKAVGLWNDLSPLHYNYGVVLIAREKLPEAEEELKKAIEIFPAYVRARFELAELLGRTGRTDEAYLQYREIVKYNSKDALNEAMQFGQDKTIVEKTIMLAQGRLEHKGGDMALEVGRKKTVGRGNR